MIYVGREKGEVYDGMASQLEKKIIEARVDNLLSMCDVLKGVKYDNEQSVRDFYFYCLSERKRGNYYALDCFKKWFQSSFVKMQSILNKRTLIKRDIEFMTQVSKKRVVFGALTFDNELDVKTEANKRKMAQRYLSKFMPMYEIIEEYGEEKGRYHIHFLGVMEDGKTFIEFHNGWSSYSYISPVRSLKKASKYLCDYVVKQVPRIRRNKLLCECLKHYKKMDFNLPKPKQEDIEKLLIDTTSELPF